MNEIPFSKQKLILKQVNLSKLTSAGKDVFKHLFGQFAYNDMTAKQRSTASKKMAEQWGLDPAKSKFNTDQKLYGRYSGDDTLPRGRYFSLATDVSGNDNGTLLNELMAYAKPDMPGLFEMYDLTVPSERDHFTRLFAGRHNTEYHRDDVLMIRLMPIYGRPHSLVASWDKSSANLPLPVYVEIPLTITEVTIDKLIDLRNRSTAEWFAKEISRVEYDLNGKPIRCFFLKPPLDDFKTLIPTLLEQNLGGGWNFCKVAGVHLRQLGADGLVYPSARCDVSVELENDEVQNSNGWNFVDYREAGRPYDWRMTDRSSKWPLVVRFSSDPWDEKAKDIDYGDVSINYVSEGNNKGSWWVDHLGQRQSAWFLTMMIKNLLQFRSMKFYEQVYPPIERLLVNQPTGEFHLGSADAVYRILRGDHTYLPQLTDLINRLMPKEQDIKKALVELIESTDDLIKRTAKKAAEEFSFPAAVLRTNPD